MNKGFESYVIKDEEGNYVDRKSIIKTGKEYFYFSFNSLKSNLIVYTKKERAGEAQRVLELHNKFGNLNHRFSIEMLTNT